MTTQNQGNIKPPVEPIPIQVQKAIKALPNIKDKVHAIAINGYMQQKKQLDEVFEKEVHDIQVKFRLQTQPFLDKMNAIIQGKVQLKDEDFEGLLSIFTPQQQNQMKNHYEGKKIDNFWLKIIQSDFIASHELRECDQPILKHLIKIEAFKGQDISRLTIKFHFEPNSFFNNTVITKQFQINDGVKRSYGDNIEWKQGKNVTVKIVKKKIKNKKTGEKVLKTKQIKQVSFFNFFKTIEIDLDQQDDDGDEQQQGNPLIQQLQRQYQLANRIYQQLIPYSIQTYLGVTDLQQLQGEDFQQFDEDQDNDQQQDQPKKGKKQSKKSKGSGSKSKSKSKSKKQ